MSRNPHRRRAGRVGVPTVPTVPTVPAPEPLEPRRLLSAAAGPAAPDARGLFVGQQYPTGLGASAVVAADFDRDGRADLATSLQTDGVISVRLSTGGGRFAPPIELAAGGTPYFVVAGDLNGDGRPDLVAQRDEAHLSVLLGKGGGRFTGPAAVACGRYPESAVLADLTGDGRPDVVTTGYYAGNVTVLPGDGTGRLGAAVSYRASVPVAVSAADFDRDGRVDVVTAGWDGFASVLLNRRPAPAGDGSVAGTVFEDRDADGRRDAGEPGLRRRLVWADLNGDGKLNHDEPRAVSGAGGRYVLSAVPAGIRVLRLEPKAGWRQTRPRGGGAHRPTVPAGKRVDGWDFGVVPITA